jgi:hypothetical protein
MKQALRDFHLLWRMACSGRNKHSGKLVTCTIVALSVAVTLTYLVQGRDALLALGVGVRTALAGLTMVEVMAFLPGAAKLNTSANAQLVPHMRRRLMQLTAGIWVAATVLATLLAFGTRLSPAVVFLATGSFIAAHCLALSGHRAGWYLQVAVYAMLAFGGGALLGEALDGAASGWHLALSTGLMCGFGVYALKAMLMNAAARPGA